MWQNPSHFSYCYGLMVKMYQQILWMSWQTSISSYFQYSITGVVVSYILSITNIFHCIYSLVFFRIGWYNWIPLRTTLFNLLSDSSFWFKLSLFEFIASNGRFPILLCRFYSFGEILFLKIMILSKHCQFIIRTVVRWVDIPHWVYHALGPTEHCLL